MAGIEKENNRFLCFSLGAEKFAIPLLQVREVIAPPPTTPVPQSPPYCVGFMNLRGEIITVLDLRKKFGVRGQDGPELSVVICQIGGVNVGLTVDQIDQVLSPAPGDIVARPEGAGGAFAEAISGVCRNGQSLVLFINIEHALRDVPLRTLTREVAAA